MGWAVGLIVEDASCASDARRQSGASHAETATRVMHGLLSATRPCSCFLFQHHIHRSESPYK